MNISKYKELIVEHWVPPVIAGVLGLIAGLSLSSFDARVSDNRFFLQKQTDTADRVALHFSTYVENWRRIIMLKESVAKESRSPTQEEVDQLLTFAANRNSSRDSLFSALDAMQLYFGEAPANLGVQFRAWDEEQSLKRSSELPRISTWQQRERTLLNAMREELLK